MKITCTRKDDIVRRMEEWDAETKRRDDIHNEENKRYKAAIELAVKPIHDELHKRLDKLNLLQISIDVGLQFNDDLEVRVRCNQDRVHDETSALSWEYAVTLTKHGDIKKQSNSWSGLSACTKEQIDSLKQTVEALDSLNSIDWKKLLDINYPEYDDYFTKQEYRGPRPYFKQELFEAEIDEAVGKNVMLKGIKNSGKSYRGDVYYIIKSVTPKMAEVSEISSYYLPEEILDNKEALKEAVEKRSSYTYKVRKETLSNMIEQPIEKIEF